MLNYKIEAKSPKVPFGHLIEKEMIKTGEQLYSPGQKHSATVLANATIETKDGKVGSIHKISANLLNKQANNGWKYWFVKRKDKLVSIDELRTQYREMFMNG